MNPFEAIYRKNKPSILSYMPCVSKVWEVEKNITVRETILCTLKEKHFMAQIHMKQQVDQGHSKSPFVEWDYNFLHLQHYKHNSLKFECCQKLAPKFYGPYTIFK
jgi:hypothetical protein